MSNLIILCYNKIKVFKGDFIMITKEQVWKGLRLQLKQEELCGINQADEYELDDYYDYEMLMNTLHKAINKEIDFEYFLDWCILVSNCYNFTKDRYETKLGKLYCSVAYLFDGISFLERCDKSALMRFIAQFKYYDFLIRKIKGQIKGVFKTKGIERIMLVDHCNRNYNSCVYKVIIRNHNTKEWEIKFVDDHDFIFDENTNYSFVNKQSFSKVFYSFFEDDTEWKEIHNIPF